VPRDRLKLLAVTVLTSFDAGDLRDLGVPPSVSVEDLVLSRARRALALGCDGRDLVGARGARAARALGEQLLIVSPGSAVREPARAPTTRSAS
jgi:orotidine-5'-phosphate decarboxylase